MFWRKLTTASSGFAAAAALLFFSAILILRLRELFPGDTLTLTAEELMRGPTSFADRADRLLAGRVTGMAHPPSTEPYNFSVPQPNVAGTHGQAAYVDVLFSGMRGGFFVESGAFDGERESNTLLLEMERGWTGILMEPQPEIFRQLLHKHRKAFCLEACLSVSAYPERTAFVSTQETNAGLRDVVASDRTMQFRKREMERGRMTVSEAQCLPLGTILHALNPSSSPSSPPVVHFFSLDVEGAEVAILQAVPWGKLDLWVILVEHLHVGQATLDKVLKPRGYVRVRQFEKDSVYVREDLLKSGKVKAGNIPVQTKNSS